MSRRSKCERARSSEAKPSGNALEKEIGDSIVGSGIANDRRKICFCPYSKDPDNDVLSEAAAYVLALEPSRLCRSLGVSRYSSRTIRDHANKTGARGLELGNTKPRISQGDPTFARPTLDAIASS